MNWKKWIWISACILVVLLIIPYGIPLILAFLTALFLDRMVQWLQKVVRFNRFQAVLAGFLSYVALIIVIGYNLISILAQQTMQLSEKTPTYVKDIYVSAIKPLILQWELFAKTLPKDVIVSIEETIEKTINTMDSFLQGILHGMITLLTSIPSFLIEFLIYLIALFLISLELPRLKDRMDVHLTDETKAKVYMVLNQLNKAGIGFIIAQIFLSLLTFALAYGGLWILDVSYKGLLALLIVIVDILPILGTGSVLVPWAVIAILQDNQMLGIGLIILFLVITVVRRVVEPKVYSTSLGISPLASLVSLYIGFKLVGLIGLILGPAIVIVYDALKRANVIKTNFKI